MWLSARRQYPNEFRRKTGVEDILGRANPEIRAFVGKLTGPLSHNRLRAKTHSLSKQIPLTRDFHSYEYPGPEYDILYSAEHRHKHWLTACETCNKCTNEEDKVCESALNSECDVLGCQRMTVRCRKRLQRAIGSAPDGHRFSATEMQEAQKPTLHFGRIACGNHVMKSGVYRDRLAAEENVIGFEMESAGTWDYVPTIVVKGVCDYADSHKNKRWQNYAALTAAACTKAILEEWRKEDGRDQGLRKADHVPGLSSQPSFPVHWTVTRPNNNLFTGRQDILDDLKFIAQGAIENTSRQIPCQIVISGMGGQGKSEICLQLVHQLRTIFWGIFWIDVSTTTLAENAFLDIASRLGAKQERCEAARQDLANTKQPWLLVLDNADDPNVDYQRYFPASTFGMAVMTSRNADCERYATEKWINLEGLAETDAQNLLFQAARVGAAQRKSLKADAQVVTQLLQSHPLALIQAGSYVGRDHCSLKDYPQMYKQQRKRLLAFRPSQARARYQDVYTTFEASAETLQMSETDTAVDTLQLLSLLAVYAPNRLPVRLFQAAWQGAQYVSSDTDIVENCDLEEITKWRLSYLPSFLHTDAKSWDSFRLVEALELLKAFSLISTDNDGLSLSISMHPLVHAWARDRLDADQQHTCWVQAGCIIAVSRLDNDLWHKHARQLQAHLQSVTLWPMGTTLNPEATIDMCRILVNCGWLCEEIRDHSTLHTLTNFLSAKLNLEPPTVDPKWLDIYDLFAENLYNWALYAEITMMRERILITREQILTRNHPKRLRIQRRLAVAYRRNRRVKDAIILLEQVIKIQSEMLADDDLDLLISQHEDAMILLERHAKIQGENLAEDHPQRLRTLHELARAYKVNGQLTDAITLLEQTVRIDEQTLAEDNSTRLVSQYELAVAYRLNGRTKDAITLMEQVTKIKEQKLPENLPFPMDSHYELALAYKEDGQITKAISSLELMVTIDRQRLAEDDPNRVSSQYELAKAYTANAQFEDAETLLREVVRIDKRAQAEDDQLRLDAHCQLSRCLWNLGKRREAFDLIRYVVMLAKQSLEATTQIRITFEEDYDWCIRNMNIEQRQ